MKERIYLSGRVRFLTCTYCYAQGRDRLLRYVSVHPEPGSSQCVCMHSDDTHGHTSVNVSTVATTSLCNTTPLPLNGHTGDDAGLQHSVRASFQASYIILLFISDSYGYRTLMQDEGGLSLGSGDVRGSFFHRRRCHRC